MTPEETARQAAAILDELDKAVVGRRRTLELVLIGILAGGHVLLEDLPGLGKTLIARSFASVLGLDFARIQFTPDLLPSDVVGAPLYDQRNGEMVFRPGPVFTQLLLADEINRTPPKTQAALLEAMGEGQVSVDGAVAAAARAVRGARDRQPDRVRGHLRAARGAARPLPDAAAPRLPDQERRDRHAAQAGRPAHRRRSRSPRSPTPPACSPCASRSSGSRSAMTCSTT